MDSGLPGNDINIDNLPTAVANILSKDSVPVQMKNQIYYGLGLKSGANLEKLTLDAGNDSWKFLRGMMEMYFQANANDPLRIKRLIEVLRNMDLEKCANEIEAWLEKNPDSAKAPPSAKGTKEPKPLLYNVEGSSPNFIGRIDEIQKLEELIFRTGPNQQNATRNVFSVSGMGGVGKTMLGREFANIFRTKYSGNANVAWIPCDTLNLAQTAFSDIAKRMSLAHGKDVSVKELAKLVYDSLKSQSRKSLFVFDNLDDPDEDWIDDILPRYEDNIFGLITSRRHDVLSKWSTLNLNVFSLEDALKLVKKYLPDLQEELAVQLAKELDCFPLALRIATAHIARSSISSKDATKEYIKTFSFEKENQTRKPRKFEMDGYSLTTGSTLKISLDKIGQLKNGGDVRDLLGVMSFLEPDEIKKEFVVEIFSRMKKTESANTNECLEILDRYSFITTESRFGHYYYKIHRLVQQLVQFELKQKEKVCILQVVVDTLCGDFFADDHTRFIIGNLIGESGKLGFEKTFICDMLHRLLIAASIFYKKRDEDCCPKLVQIDDNFIRRHLVNGTDAGLQLIPHYYREMKGHFFHKRDPAMQTLFIGILGQMQIIKDPIISTVLFVHFLFLNKPFKKSEKLLEKICEMDLDEINERILPLEENGLISRICRSSINKVSSECGNDSNESNQILLYAGNQDNTTGAALKNCRINSPHISRIGCYLEWYLRENVSRMNLSLINNIRDLEVSYDFGITVPLYLLYFKNNPLGVDEYLVEWKLIRRFKLASFDYIYFGRMDDKDLIDTLRSLPYNLTYGELSTMIFNAAFYYLGDNQVDENVEFAVDVLKTLAKNTPITKDLINNTSPLFSGKISSITEDDLPDELKIIKTNLEKEIVEEDTKNELTKLAFVSYLTKSKSFCITKYKNHEFFTIPLKLAKTLIRLGYGYERYRTFYLNPLVTCVVVAYATIAERFKFYQYVVRNWKSYLMTLYLNTWFLLYEKFFEQENLKFDEDDLLFPLRIVMELDDIASTYLKRNLLKSFSSVLHSARLATNPVIIQWKQDLTICFEILKIDRLSFLDKLDRLLERARAIYGDFVYTDGSKRLKSRLKSKSRDYPVLIGVINKLRSS